VTSRLGPDPLRRGAGSSGASAAAFRAALARRSTPLAAVLLDQTVVAGIGNVFRSELAFLIGVDPRRPADSLDDDQAAALWRAAVEQLRAGVRRNRIVSLTDADARRVAGTTPGRLAGVDALYVYKRHDQPCRRCAAGIGTAELAGRRIWWCPSCQR
ncbi:MAG TPA: hypothetical protein DEP69_03700, partial [Acidimicrobiaceae bacterium]|nr:hypothetical protein [Acidimicrobiaceae bacterium]